MSNFLSEFYIQDKLIGDGKSTFVIAEAGVAHFGDMVMAHKLLSLAIESGADAFKIQIFDVNYLISKSASDWQDRLRPRNLSYEQVKELKQRCDENNIIFMATAHDDSRIEWLESLDVAAVKIGSGERNNIGFISRLAQLGKPVILSTGMYSETDIVEVLDIFQRINNSHLALLHCVTSYPTPVDEVNLHAMNHLKQIFSGPVGYSDHTIGNLAVLSAVAAGACIIEKHITIEKNIPNAQDWKVSADLEEMKSLVRDIRLIEQMRGDGIKKPTRCEQPAEVWALKSIVAARSLEPGHIIQKDDLTAKRPGGGLPANKLELCIGKKLIVPVEQDDIIQLENLV